MQNLSANSVLSDFMERLRAASQSALLLDYDGTLAPFQTDRTRAFPYPGVVDILERIIRRGKTKVVMITGRPLHELQALFSPLESVEAWGAHGLEHKLADGTYQQAVVVPEASAILLQAEKWLDSAGLGSLIEKKPGGIAVHWRGLSTDEVEKVQACLRREWLAFAQLPGLKLVNFEGGVELRVAHPNKGDAITSILQDLDPQSEVAFLGDDLTDEDAFRTLASRGLSVLVRPDYRETKAKVWLKPPDELIAFLEQWLSNIG